MVHTIVLVATQVCLLIGTACDTRTPYQSLTLMFISLFQFFYLFIFLPETFANQSGSLLLLVQYIGGLGGAHFVIQRGFDDSTSVDTEFRIDHHGHFAGDA